MPTPASAELPIGRIEVATGARLHFGLISHGRIDGPNHGGCGMVVDAPGCLLRFERSETDSINTASGVNEEDVESVIRKVRDRVREVTGRGEPIAIEVERIVPRHTGLGSGTQLASAVVLGMSHLDGEKELSARDLRTRSGRGRRSSIGIHGFLKGGFLVDGGKTDESREPPVERLDVPSEWRVVLCTPIAAVGLSSHAERDAFARLPPTTDEQAAELSHILTHEVRAALRNGNFRVFSRSLFEYGQRVGDLFAPVQGGTYSHASTARLVRLLRESGVEGVGQTSWGPTVFAFTESESAADEIAGSIRAKVSGDEVFVRVVRPLNRGAPFKPI